MIELLLRWWKERGVSMGRAGSEKLHAHQICRVHSIFCAGRWFFSCKARGKEALKNGSGSCDER